MKWFTLRCVDVLEGPSQSPDANLREDFKIVVHRHSLPNLIEFKLFWKEKLFSRGSKLLETHLTKKSSCNCS